ncbi:MAG: GNAT family N-acetyltransferase [Acetivibrionales bacterium]|jgi:ribosomal protein S18 acetylase RimI-like enzyme
MHIRNAEIDDLPVIMKIYEKARIFMRNNGNPTQWASGYPKEEIIRKDIADRNLYVCIENDTIVGVFAFVIGDEPAYQTIKQGNWRSSMQYGTIHRIASDGSTRGIAKSCFDFCSKKCNYLRVDTHRDNKPMQAAIKKYGFQKCGIIRIQDGTERIAYDYLPE